MLVNSSECLCVLCCFRCCQISQAFTCSLLLQESLNSSKNGHALCCFRSCWIAPSTLIRPRSTAIYMSGWVQDSLQGMVLVWQFFPEDVCIMTVETMTALWFTYCAILYYTMLCYDILCDTLVCSNLLSYTVLHTPWGYFVLVLTQYGRQMAVTAEDANTHFSLPHSAWLPGCLQPTDAHTGC